MRPARIGKIADKGADNAALVDAVVPIEAPILRRDDTQNRANTLKSSSGASVSSAINSVHPSRPGAPTFAVTTLDTVKAFPPCDCCDADLAGTQIGVGLYLCEIHHEPGCPKVAPRYEKA